MVAKCANPGCSAPFLYMRQGKLFRVETPATHDNTAAADEPTFGRPARHLEFFWLCDDCAPLMTITVRPGQGVVVHPIEQAAMAAALSL
jgi:hypothetical protein